MMDPEDVDYVCSLDTASIKKAKDELNEDPQDRLSAVKALRDWIKAQPHILCPLTDTNMMLTFLRGAKFSQLRARQMVEDNLGLRDVAPEWFLDIDSQEKNIQDILRLGYVTVLPKRTKEGCAVVLYQVGSVAPKKYSFDDTIRAACVIGSKISRSEMTQVNGTVMIMDFTGVTMKHMTAMLDRKAMGKWHKVWTKTVPGRFKGIHYYNAGVIFEYFMTMSRPFLPKKFQDRIHLHNTLESLYKHVSMDVLPHEYLPDDYSGSTIGSVKDIINQLRNETLKKEFRDDLLYRTSKAFRIDRSLKPITDTTEHFRKLNVD